VSATVPARAVALVAAVLVIAGCSDLRAANEANFRRVLEPVAREAYCRTVNVGLLAAPGTAADAGPWPLTVAAEPPPVGYDRMERPRLDEAVRAGLLTRTAARLNATGVGSDQPARAQDVVTYAPTEAGRRYMVAVAGRTMGGVAASFPAICDALGEVTAVVRWTEPADAFGRRVSRVTYRYRGTDPRPGLPTGQVAQVGTEQERTLALGLTGDGWRPAS